MFSFGDGLTLALGLLVIVLLVLAGALLNFGSRRAARVLAEVEVHGGLVDKFAGGLRWPFPGGLGSSSMPPVLVSLELYAWGLRIGARWRFLGLFMPSWYVRYEEIILAEHAHRAMRASKRGSEGVRLRAPAAGGPMIFWTSNWSGLLDLLEARGVAVVRRSTATGFWSNQ